MKKLVIALCICMLIISCKQVETKKSSTNTDVRAQSGTKKDITRLDAVVQRFIKQYDYFNEPTSPKDNYVLDIAMESLINYTLLTKDSTYKKYINRFFEKRDYAFSDTIDYFILPFSNCYFTFYLLKKDDAFIAPYVYETNRMRDNVARTPEGAICVTHKNKNNMLIDYLQMYCSRMARTGFLLSDTSYYSECVMQFEIYRDIVQYKDSKLYSQGRGWLNDKSQLSPTCWSRGQGWLLRGMVASLEYIPENTVYFSRLQSIVREFADALIARQNENGMWHTLPCFDHSESFPEVSGTGMIAYYMATAYMKGFLKDEKYKDAAQKAIYGLKKYVSPEDGTIHNVSKGPGTLWSVDEYRQKGETNEKHGTQAVIYALTADVLLNARKK